MVYVAETAGGDSSIGVSACTSDGSSCSPITVSGPPAQAYRYVPDLAYNYRRNEFLAVWREFTSGLAAKHIYARRVGLTGGLSALSGVIQISSVSNNEDDPVVAVVPRDPEGQYMVVWSTYDVTAKGNIWAQRIAGNGALEGSASSMAMTTDDEVMAAIAGSTYNAQYLITWTRRNSTNTLSNIQGRAVDTNGSYAGEVQNMIPVPPGVVGTSTPENSAVASGPIGDFLISSDDVSSSIRKVYGILWGTRLYLPLVAR